MRAQNVDKARELIAEAVTLKPNYTDALNFLTELDLAAGNTDQAIATTRSIINIEPNNPARYYQLAILLSTKNDIDGSVSALERAVALNPNYANARYLLALAYAQQDRVDDAIAQLTVVRDLNPNNETVTTLIDQLQSGDYEPSAPASTQPVSEPEVVVSDDSNVTASEAPDTPLISPVNAVPDTSQETVTAAGADNATETSAQ